MESHGEPTLDGLGTASLRWHLSYDQEDDKRLRRAMEKAFIAEAIARTEALRRKRDWYVTGSNGRPVRCQQGMAWGETEVGKGGQHQTADMVKTLGFKRAVANC